RGKSGGGKIAVGDVARVCPQGGEGDGGGEAGAGGKRREALGPARRRRKAAEHLSVARRPPDGGTDAPAIPVRSRAAAAWWPIRNEREPRRNCGRPLIVGVMVQSPLRSDGSFRRRGG